MGQLRIIFFLLFSFNALAVPPRSFGLSPLNLNNFLHVNEYILGNYSLSRNPLEPFSMDELDLLTIAGQNRKDIVSIIDMKDDDCEEDEKNSIQKELLLYHL